MKPPCPTCQQTHNPENACREAQPVAEQLRASLKWITREYDDAQSSAIEAYWKEKQGEDYGSY